RSDRLVDILTTVGGPAWWAGRPGGTASTCARPATGGERVSDERVQFPTVMRGYDKSHVDSHVASLEQALAEARAQVEQLDAKTMQIAGELSEAHRQLREAERPTYSGLGSRIEQLLRSAEGPASDVVAQANAQASDTLARAKLAAGQLRARAENEVAEMLATARSEERRVGKRGGLGGA